MDIYYSKKENKIYTVSNPTMASLSECFLGGASLIESFRIFYDGKNRLRIESFAASKILMSKDWVFIGDL